MREKAIIFGKSARLVGVTTIPGRGEAKDGAPGLIVLNSGMLHRVGAGRLSVRVIRALAADGHPGLRFDFSGLGDSDNRADGLPFEKRCTAETQEAMDYMAQKHGVQRFVLMGLCSGADIAFETAQADPRIAGLIQIDPFAYRTPQFYLHYVGYFLRQHGVKVFRPKDWWRITDRYALRRLRTLLGQRTLADKYPDLVESPFQRGMPPKEDVAAGLEKLVGRGVRILNIFTAGMQNLYNHQQQYVDCFRGIDFRGRLTVRYLARADHTLELRHLQEHVIADLRAWLGEFPLMSQASSEAAKRTKAVAAGH